MDSREASLKDPKLLTAPAPFGFKTAWFTIRSEDSGAVAEALEVKNPQSVNWEYGVWSGYSNDYRIFVSPPVRSWVLAMGLPILFEADDHAFERVVDLSKRFGEAQFFASMRVSSCYMWACASQGSLLRMFYEGDGQRRVLGEETATERELGFKFFDPSSPESQEPGYWERKDLTFPDEQSVLEVAAKWSIDPSKLDEMELPPAYGLLGKPSASYPPKPEFLRPKRFRLIKRLLGLE